MASETANILGALSLAVVDRIEDLAQQLVGHAGQTPAAIVVIGYGPGMTNDRLRRILRLSHPGTVRLVDRLVADGLVERRAGRDRRAVALHLTEQGEALRATLLAERLSLLEGAAELLSPSEQSQLAVLLRKLLAAMPRDQFDRFRICRLCDNRACVECPIPAL
ncbi:MarR family transcriptional regulator [Sphingomonas sp.]|uniref:MarR family winged helix-turn-helix transcriptional regulator n=1 Tax=Sphingomonas sp. TaxID=28214 RepID=UPI001DC6D0DB|nr:MarR family transcriptional regulator [Sphingomonas sp.]MBX9796218.1 MarR family transcriptional regulator [Sphingomonas sp.]